MDFLFSSCGYATHPGPDGRHSIPLRGSFRSEAQQAAPAPGIVQIRGAAGSMKKITINLDLVIDVYGKS